MKTFWLAGMLPLLLAGCKAAVAPTPPLAPAVSPLDPPVPAAAVPTALYSSYPNTYGVMLCIEPGADDLLCWYPPAGTVTVQ